MDWPALPNDVIAHFWDPFAHANRQVTETLENCPATRESSLDDMLIGAETAALRCHRQDGHSQHRWIETCPQVGNR